VPANTHPKLCPYTFASPKSFVQESYAELKVKSEGKTTSNFPPLGNKKAGEAYMYSVVAWLIILEEAPYVLIEIEFIGPGYDDCAIMPLEAVSI
jgi:hypothetical protein